MADARSEATAEQAEPAVLVELANTLRNAYTDGPVDPVRFAVPDQRAAYDIQQINTRYWISRDRRLVGRKIGLTSPAVQRQLGVAEPDAGMLFADMAIPDRGVLRRGELLQPKIEAELAFVLKDDLDLAEPTWAEVVNATDFVAPAFEIVDSRIRDWDIDIRDTVADNASSGRFVIGEGRSMLADVDLPNVAMRLYCGPDEVSRGTGADCLGNPLVAVCWLAAKMQALGRPLRAGDVVLSGALGPMVSLASPGEYRSVRCP